MIGKNSEFFTKELLSKLVTDIGVAFWVWDVIKDELHYNKSFFELVGYKDKEETFDLNTWKSIIHPDDREISNKAITDFLEGRTDNYLVECRVVKENGEIIWILDSGKVTEYGEDGSMKFISGITQDITKRKTYEEQLSIEQNKLNLAMKFASFSVWEWDITTNKVTFDKGYASTLGYTQDEWDLADSKWLTIIHPDDLPEAKEHISKCVLGDQTAYDHKLRIRKSNGKYEWVRDIAEISEFNKSGKATKIIGGRINIHELEEATIKLENYKDDLENQILQRTKELHSRDKVLLELNEMSQKLMTTQTSVDYSEIAYKYLDEFSSLQENARIAVFRNKEVDGRIKAYLANEPRSPYRKKFTIGYVREVFKDKPMSFLSEGMLGEDKREEFYNMMLEKVSSIDFDNLDYEQDFPLLYEHMKQNKTLNINSKDFGPKEYAFSQLQGLKTVLMSPIVINNQQWGFIMIDNYEVKNFTKEDEKTLNLVGAVIAQAIHKNELELKANEAIEYNELMLNANPLSCNLWKDGVNINSNEATAKLFKLNSPDEIRDKIQYLSPKFQPCGERSDILIEEKFKETLETGNANFEWLHCDTEGELIPTEITMVKIPYHGENIVATYVRDMRVLKELLTSMEEAQEHLRHAHEEAMLSSQAKSNFLANMSHEIRTPMNAISGMTDIILRDTNDSEVNEYALNIKRACDSLISIINDVLDISKIESGKLDIVEGEYKLSQVLADVLSISTNRLESKPIMFTTNFQSDIPENIIGDDIRIKQIMVNILGNAIKFTNEGSINFEVTGKWADGILNLSFSVEDTGAGISQNDLEKLFIEFERINTKKNRNVEGTGLGLAISKRLCEMMQGRIEVESEVGKGTKFTITVIQKYNEYEPLAKVEDSKSILIFETRELFKNSLHQSCDNLKLTNVVFCSLQSEFNEALQVREFDYVFTSSMYLVKVQEMLLKYEYKSKIVLLADTVDIKSKYDYPTVMLPANTISIANVLNGKTTNNDSLFEYNKFTAPDCKILVVDDNSVNLKVAQGLMRPYKMDIDTAENGLEAVKKIQETKYDLVFMDHMMPIMDGIDATIAVRNLEDDYYKTMPIIALTANAIIGTKEIFINEGMNDFLAKPIKLSALNEMLSKWVPKEKQIELIKEEKALNQPIEQFDNNTLNIPNLNTNAGIQSIGGCYDTYIDILSMYYKDGIKRIPNIENLFDKKQILDFKIEVHALKSASASVGAMQISNKAKLLEEASINGDWDFIEHNTLDFISCFNILLEDIREALKGIINTNDTSDKELGDDDFYIEKMNNLIQALDDININLCEIVLKELFNFNWNEEKLNILNQVQEFVDGYEYDDAVELIKSNL